MRKAVFPRLKNHLFATDLRKPQIRNSFSFNPKICVHIRIDEVLDSIFVTDFGTKNVILFTITTNHPRK